MVQSRVRHKKIFIIIIVSLIIISVSKFDSSYLNLNYNQIDNSTTNKLKISNSPTWDFKTSDTHVELVISSDGNYIVVGGDVINDVYLFHRSNSSPAWSYKLNGGTFDIAISSDGKYFVIGSNDNKIYFFDRSNSSPLWTYTTNDVVMSVAISSDGNYIVAGGRENKIYLFNKNSSTPIWSSTLGLSTNRFAIAISSDGNYIVAGNSWSRTYLFNRNSSTPIWSHTSDSVIYSVAISSEGNYIVVGDLDETTYLFNRVSSTPLWNYTADDNIQSVAISSDGNYIVAGSEDHYVYLFSKNSSTPLWRYLTSNVVLDVAMSSDGNYFVAGSRDYNVYLFSVNSSKPLRKYNSGEVICSVDISSDGSYIVAGSWDGSVLLFHRLSWKVPFNPFYLNLLLAILIPIVILMVLLGGYLKFKERIILAIKNKRELKAKVYAEVGKQTRYRNLKCIRCGTKEGGIFEYKSQGIIPTCYKCRRKFQIRAYSKILLFFLGVVFTIVTLVLLFFIPGLEQVSSVALPWIITLMPYSISLLVAIIAIIILRMKFGSKLKNYFRYNEDGFIKSEIDTEWVSYRDWINKILTERSIPDSEKLMFIENEVSRQNAIKVKKTKRAKSYIIIGYCNISVGITSLIYGLIVSQGLPSPYWLLPFVTVHVPSAGVFLLFGIIYLLSGKKKKTFFNLL